jgi:hypothetical protein
MIAGTLEVQMLANLARLQKDMTEAKGIVAGAARAIEATAVGLTAALGAIGIGSLMANWVTSMRHVIDTADELNKASQKFGVTVESLSSMSFAAKLANVQFGDLETGLKKLSVNAAAAAGGAKEQGRVFEAMGVKVQGAGGQLKATDDLLREIADKFAGYRDGAGKAALATELFGKSGVNLIPLLNQMRASEDEAKKLGVVYSKDLAKAAEDFNDNITRMNALMEANKISMANGLVPGLNKLMEHWLEANRIGGSFLGTLKLLTQQTNVFASPGQNLNQLGKELESLQDRLSDPKFMSSMPGSMPQRYKARIEEIKTQIEWEKSLQRQQALAIKGGDTAGERARAGGDGLVNAPVVKKIDAEALAEIKAFESALRSLTDQLEQLNNQTMEEKTRYDLTVGSLKRLTPEHGAELIAVAKLIDAKKQEQVASASLIAAIEAQIAAQDALNASVAEFISTNKRASDDIAFETKTLGLNTVQREQANAARKIEADYNKLAGAASEIPDIVKQTAEIERLRKARDAAIATRSEEIEKQQAAQALNPKLLDQMEFENKLIGMTNVQREEAIALRQLELTGIDKTTEAYQTYIARLKDAIQAKDFAESQKTVLVDMWQDVERVAHDTFASIFDSGKSAFDRLRDTLKNGLASLLYNLTIKPLLINIVSSASGAGIAQSAFGSAATGGANIGSILGLGNSAMNLAGGAGSGIYGAFATSSLGQTLGLSSIVPDAIGLGALEGGGTVALSGLGAGIGTALPYIGLGLAALSIGKSLFGSNKKPAVFTGGIVRGTADQSGFAGSYYGTSQGDHYSEWAYPAYTDQADSQLDKIVGSAFADMTKYAKALKLDTAGLADISASFSISGVGQSPADVVEAFANNIGTLTDEIALKLLPNVADFSMQGESLTGTFVRLAETAKAAQDALDAQSHTQQLELLEAQGKAVEALAMKREDELKAIDPTLRATQRMIYALQDQAAAAEKVSGAEDALRKAYRDQSGVLTETITKWRDAAKALREYGGTLTGNVSGQPSYAQAAAQFAITAAQARSGDLGAIGRLQSVSEAFRTASLASSSTALDYQRDIAKIRIAVSDSATNADLMGDVAQQQLDALTEQVSALIKIDESVLSVEDAIKELAAQNAASNAILAAMASAKAQEAYEAQKAISDSALAALRAAVSAQPEGEQVRQFEDITKGPAGAFDYQQFSYAVGQEADLSHARELNAKYAEEFAAAYALWKSIPGHASGGVASGLSLVGEEGRELVDFSSPGRVYTASQTAGMFAGNAELLNEVRALREEVAGLRQENNSGNMSIFRKLNNLDANIDRVTERGTHMIVIDESAL